MDIEEFGKKIKEKAKKIKIELDNNQVEKFFIYMEQLLEYNEKVNLTAITNPDEIILKHFIDSMTISKYIKLNSKIIDIGTGAGFPGIPLKIIRDDLEVTLLDSLNKRVVFLNDIIKKLDLKEICSVHSRVEEYAKNKKNREKYDCSTSRAVANMATLSEYLLPLVKIGGKSICMKGSNIDEELEKGKNAIKVLGGKIVEVDNFKLPETNYERNIVIIEKVENTPLKYPRKAGTPSKEPII